MDGWTQQHIGHNATLMSKKRQRETKIKIQRN